MNKAILKFENGVILDLSEVFMIGKIGGQQHWLAYRVHFRSGEWLEINESRSSDGLLMMPRQQFVQAWMDYKNSLLPIDKINL